jgi:hypothetical protein
MRASAELIGRYGLPRDASGQVQHRSNACAAPCFQQIDFESLVAGGERDVGIQVGFKVDTTSAQISASA